MRHRNYMKRKMRWGLSLERGLNVRVLRGVASLLHVRDPPHKRW